MIKESLKTEALELIAEQIARDYYYGFFDILDDETGKYITVDWELKVDFSEND